MQHLLANVLSRSAMKSSSSLVSPSLAEENNTQLIKTKNTKYTKIKTKNTKYTKTILISLKYVNRNV